MPKNYVSGEELAYIATTVAVAISKDITNTDDLNTISCIFNAIGDSISIIASQRTANESAKEATSKDSEKLDKSNKDSSSFDKRKKP